MNLNGELEMEQWSCSSSTTPNPSPPCNNMNNVLIDDDDTINAMKSEVESEGLLLLKHVEVKGGVSQSSRSGKSFSPDTGYVSDNIFPGNERETSDFRSPTLSIHSMASSTFSTSTLGRLKEEQTVVSNVPKMEDENFHLNKESSALDLTISKNQAKPSNIAPINYSLPAVNELKAPMPAEVQSLIGVSVLESVLESSPPIDTILSCSDGKLGAHRIVLTASSKFLYELFNGQRLEEIVVVILPDITKKTMTSLLKLAYTGQMIYTEDMQDEIFSAMELLLFGDLSKLSLFPVITKTSPSAADETDNVVPEDKLTTHAETSNIGEIRKKEVTVDESSIEVTPCSSNSSTLKMKNKSAIWTCNQCPRTFAKKGSLHLHTTRCHSKECHATVGEMQMMSFCDICDRQYKTVGRAMFCYNQHGLTRCLICLGVFPTTEIKDHYFKVHANKEGEDVVVKCRWCSRAVSVKTNCNSIASHSSIHWPGASSGKRQEEPTTATKIRPKKTKTVASESSYRSKKLTLTSDKKSFVQAQPAGSKKRRRSDCSEDDFHLRRNKPQYAIRTGKPVGLCRDEGLTMEEPKIITKNDRYRHNHLSAVTVDNPVKTQTVMLDVNHLPKIVIKLDSMEKINKLLKRSSQRSNTKSNKHPDEKKARKENAEISTAVETLSNDSIRKVKENLQSSKEEVILSIKETNGELFNLNLKDSGMDKVTDNINDSADNKLSNTDFGPDMSQENRKPSNFTKQSSTYPMSYFPTRLNKPPLPMEDKDSNICANSTANESLTHSLTNIAVNSPKTAKPCPGINSMENRSCDEPETVTSSKLTHDCTERSLDDMP